MGNRVEIWIVEMESGGEVGEIIDLWAHFLGPYMMDSADLMTIASLCALQVKGMTFHHLAYANKIASFLIAADFCIHLMYALKGYSLPSISSDIRPRGLIRDVDYFVYRILARSIAEERQPPFWTKRIEWTVQLFDAGEVGAPRDSYSEYNWSVKPLAESLVSFELRDERMDIQITPRYCEEELEKEWKIRVVPMKTSVDVSKPEEELINFILGKK